jgi:hypothetical protein
MEHPPHSPDLAPNNCWFFLKINSALKGKIFEDNGNTQNNWTNCTFGLYPSSGVTKIEELKIYTKYHNTHVHKIHTRVNY